MFSDVAHGKFLLCVGGDAFYPCLVCHVAVIHYRGDVVLGDIVHIIICKGKAVGVVPDIFAVVVVYMMQSLIDRLDVGGYTLEDVVRKLFYFLLWGKQSAEVEPFASAGCGRRQMEACFVHCLSEKHPYGHVVVAYATLG